jgi:hypothetical protein
MPKGAFPCVSVGASFEPWFETKYCQQQLKCMSAERGKHARVRGEHHNSPSNSNSVDLHRNKSHSNLGQNPKSPLVNRKTQSASA